MAKRLWPHWPRLAVAAGLCAAGAAQAATVTLTPELAGQYARGKGVDGTFIEVFDDWHQSSVLWNEATGEFGSGKPVGEQPWGAGLWGLADWQTANHGPTPGMIQSALTVRVGQISFGDKTYNDAYARSWGAVALAPLFEGTGQTLSQDNWTSSFSGYVRIAEAGVYNFGVLHDDGFFFKLGGADASVEIANDYLNPRDRLGFADNLALTPGLYSFELGAYDHLEAGVVELSWSVNGGDWKVIPTPHLVAEPDVLAVPEPATSALMAAGVLALVAVARRRAIARRD